MQFNIDGVTAWNDYVPGGHQLPPTGGGTGSDVAVGTQLTGSVTLGTSYSPTTINCYANGTQIYHLLTYLSSGEWNFNWTPSAAGTYTVYCNEDQVTTPNIYVPVEPTYQGFVSPKYKVVGIAYTVPGEQSYVQYTDTTMMGTSTSTSNSFSDNVTTSVSVCGSTGSSVCGQGNGVAVTGTYTNSFTQESDTSSSFAVDQTTAFVNQLSPLTGPGLDHGNDVIYVWVNPNVWYTVTTPGAPLEWNGYTYDLSDDSNNMEVIPLRLSELLNPSTIDTYTLGRLQRAWALTNTDDSSPAITDQDLLNIAAQDPFSNPNYTVTIGPDHQTTTDGRFTQTTNNEMWYLPGYADQYKWSYTGTTTAGQGAKTTYSDEFALEEKFAGSFFWQAVSYDLKQSTTFTWVDQWNTLTTGMQGQSAVVQIADAPADYPGPNEFNVYQDNIYGTFMVYPVPPQ